MKNKYPPPKPVEKYMAKRCWVVIGGILAAAICFIALIEFFYPIQLL